METELSKNNFTVVAEPSQAIKHYEQVVVICGVEVCFTLVTMKRSFLLVIDNPATAPQNAMMGFMKSNSTLKGLSLAIGEHSTCIIDSQSSIASATLASRLSKKFNQNRPVYVANNFQPAHDMIDSEGFISKLYLKTFQFVESNYVKNNPN